MGNEVKVAEGLDFGVITHLAVRSAVSDDRDHTPHIRSDIKAKLLYTGEAKCLFQSEKA